MSRRPSQRSSPSRPFFRASTRTVWDAVYYASQPLGMTAEYTLQETRRLAPDLVLGYLSVDFSFTDRPTLTVYLSVIARHVADTWLIDHYQVSRLG